MKDLYIFTVFDLREPLDSPISETLQVSPMKSITQSQNCYNVSPLSAMAVANLYILCTNQRATKSIHWIFLQQQLETKRLEHESVADEMLAHSLHPM